MKLLLCLFLAAVSVRIDARPLRPSSVPVVACDPFFSVWSPSEIPTQADTENWFGARQPISVIVELDGVKYRLLGAKQDLDKRERGVDVPALRCSGCEVRPLTTVFRYETEGREVELRFCTPKLADDLNVFSRPVTYLTVCAGGTSEIKASVVLSSALATNDDAGEMVTNRSTVSGLPAWCVGRRNQTPLSMKGDMVRCDWGYAWAVDAGTQGHEANVVLAYDDVESLRFLGKTAQAWWRRDGKRFEDMLAEAVADRESVLARAAAFDRSFLLQMEKVGGRKYAELCALAYRQSFAACKLVSWGNGQMLYFSKENTSNGSMGTVDVLYPQLPLLLLVAPDLARASLESVLIYAESGKWPYKYAPHAVGSYPIGDGQTYQMTGIDGHTGKPMTDASRMPVEECGNMLISLCALTETKGSAAWLEGHWQTLTDWATYLERFGFDPGEQLCTDDFAGRLAHNANLSLKTIMAFASYARLADRSGRREVSDRYRRLAENAASKWIEATRGGAAGGSRLTFDRAGTWSLKYNLIWDRVLGFGLFPPEVSERELSVYRDKALPYGVPLDCRSDYTKVDWEFWCAALTGRREDLDFFTEMVWRYVDETPDRHPFPDWYFANNARVRGFLGRSVIGGVFMPAFAARMTGDASRAPDVATVYAWRGEKAVVWRDVTNGTEQAVLVRPSGSAAWVRAGLAMSVRGDKDVLFPDRVVWGGSTLVRPGEFVRLVAEISVPCTGEVPRVISVMSGLGSFDWTLDVCERPFPDGKDRRMFLDLWQHPWAVARYFQVEPFSKAHYDRMRPLWRELASAGQKAITCTIMPRPWAHQCFDEYGTMVRHVRLDAGGWRFDYALFDEYVDFADACGLGPQIHCYSLCPFRLKRYVWEDERGKRAEGDFDVGSPEWRDYWTAFLEDFAAHLKAKGWFDRAYIGLDERSPAELKDAVGLVRAHGGFKIQMAGDRAPSEFDGIAVDNFSIALQFVTPKYVAEAHDRRKAGRFTTVYTAGCTPCTSLRHAPENIQWLGAYPGAVGLDGYLRWAFCSWPANPNSDAVYNPWFGTWAAGGTFLHYPDGPSLRYLGLKNGLNLAEKIRCLRDEGRIDAGLQAVLDEFEYKGPDRFSTTVFAVDLFERASREVQRISRDFPNALDPVL